LSWLLQIALQKMVKKVVRRKLATCITSLRLLQARIQKMTRMIKKSKRKSANKAVSNMDGDESEELDESGRPVVTHKVGDKVHV